jgi:alpha-L-fucosidase 2
MKQLPKLIANLQNRETFCSAPDQVCVYYIRADSLPSITVGLENQLASPSPALSCKSNSINLNGTTAAGLGMVYNARATVVIPGETGKDHCSNSSSQVVVPAGKGEVFVVIAAGTQYDSEKGNSDAYYSFRGEDPSELVSSTATAAAETEYEDLREAHVADYRSFHNTFNLTLPGGNGSSTELTKSLIDNYDSATGNPFVENLLFDFGRYLFISSSRQNQGGLPPNLQGLWTEQLTPAWSADYHADINIQMNHWGVEQTGLGSETEPLWTYITNTWMPRGAETAKLLYGSDEGWVTHVEMNIFGHTAYVSEYLSHGNGIENMLTNRIG